jgi:hypothetical protein
MINTKRTLNAYLQADGEIPENLVDHDGNNNMKIFVSDMEERGLFF